MIKLDLKKAVEFRDQLSKSCSGCDLHDGFPCTTCLMCHLFRISDNPEDVDKAYDKIQDLKRILEENGEFV